MNNVDFNIETALKQLKQNWKWYLALGAGLVALGSLGIIFTTASTVFSMAYLGCMIVIFGIFEGIKAFKLNQWGSFLLHLAIAALCLAGGALMFVYPLENAVTLTLFLAIAFVVTGVLRVGVAVTKNVPHKGWLAINGLSTIILGILIWYQWPASGLWAIGMLVSIDMIFTGWTWIMVALRAKKLS